MGPAPVFISFFIFVFVSVYLVLLFHLIVVSFSSICVFISLCVASTRNKINEHSSQNFAALRTLPGAAV